jgi:Tol biopolymer transport system component
MVIRRLVVAMSLGFVVLTTSEVSAQSLNPTPSASAVGISFATPDGLFKVQPLNSPRETLMTSESGLLNSLVWSPDGQQLAVVQNYGAVYRLSPTDNRATQVFSSQCERPANLELTWQDDRETLLIQQRCSFPDAQGHSQWDVFLADGAGQLTAVTLIPKSIESDLYVAPDGERIAYVANQHIYVAELNQTTPRQITLEPGVYTSAGSPLVWSPDGSQLAFYEGTYPFQRINLIHVDSGDRRLLTPEPDFQIYRSRLIWSPSGEYIAFYQPVNPPLSNQEVIMLLNVATGDRQIMTGPGFYSALSWSPDSQKLAFAAGTQVEQQALFTLEIASQEFTTLTPQPWQAILDSRWAPQGDWIAFTAIARGDDLGTQILQVVQPDAGQLTPLTQPHEYAYPFAWRPSAL